MERFEESRGRRSRVARAARRHGPLARWLRFNLVGAFGSAVQLGTLALLVRAAGAHYLTATLVAVEASLLHNYVWHTRWTWTDRLSLPIRHARLLARFHVTSGGLSVAANLVALPLLVGVLGLDVVVANCATIVVCGVLNFVLSDRWSFVG